MNNLGRGSENGGKDREKIFTRETAGIILVLFSVLALVVLFSRDVIFGNVGFAISSFLLGVFGYCSVAVLAALIYAGSVLITGKRLAVSGKTAGFCALLLVFLVCLVHTITAAVGGIGYGSYGEYLSACYAAGERSFFQSTGGGVLFGLVVYPVCKLTTSVGGYIIFSLLTVGAGYLVYAAASSGRSSRRAAKQPSEPAAYATGDTSSLYDLNYAAQQPQSAPEYSAQAPAASDSAPQPAAREEGAERSKRLYAIGDEFDFKSRRELRQESREERRARENIAPAAPAAPSAYEQGRSILYPDRPAMQYPPQYTAPMPSLQDDGGDYAWYKQNYAGGKSPSVTRSKGSASTSSGSLYSSTGYTSNRIFDEKSYFNKPDRARSLAESYSKSFGGSSPFSEGHELKSHRSQPAKAQPEQKEQPAPAAQESAASSYSQMYADAAEGNISYSNRPRKIVADATAEESSAVPAQDFYRNDVSAQPQSGSVYGSAQPQSGSVYGSAQPQNTADTNGTGVSFQSQAQPVRSEAVPGVNGNAGNYDVHRAVRPEPSRDSSIDAGDIARRFGFGSTERTHTSQPHTDMPASRNAVPPENTSARNAVPTENNPVRNAVPPENTSSRNAVPTENNLVRNAVPPEDTSARNTVSPENNPVRNVVPPEDTSVRLNSSRDEAASRPALRDRAAEPARRDVFSPEELPDRDVFERPGEMDLRAGEDLRPDSRRGGEDLRSGGRSGGEEVRGGAVQRPETKPVRGIPVQEPEEEQSNLRPITDAETAADLFDDDEPEESSVPAAMENAGREEERPSLTLQRDRIQRELPQEEAPRPKHVYAKYNPPPISLLTEYPHVAGSAEDDDINVEIIIQTLANLHVPCEMKEITQGPSVTRYDIEIPGNIPTSRVLGYDKELAMRLHAAAGVNVQLNYENGSISIEVPREKKETVGLRDLILSPDFVNAKPGALVFGLGKDIEGRAICGDVVKMTHLLVAGATNSGKSVCLHALILSLLYKYSPEDLRLILVDPKQNEFIIYDKLPHLMINEIIADPAKVVNVLNWAIAEMERRYTLFKEKTKKGTLVRDVNDYNANLTPEEEKLPKIVMVIDELADLMSVAKKDIEDRIQRLTQKSRAAGIHLVLATQRPSVNIITGVIKSNLPTRIALKVTQEVDSRTILDESGAEKLLGQGDLLYRTASMTFPKRVQGAFVSNPEMQSVISYIKEHNEAYFDDRVADYINNQRQGGGDASGGADDSVEAVYIDALRAVVSMGQASISMIQRRCGVGYPKAGKIIEWMENMGYIATFNGSKARDVLMTKEEFESKYGDYGE